MSVPADLRLTPLTAQHEAAGARLVDFAGFVMPVQYDGILAEVERVRKKAGLFDLEKEGEGRAFGADHVPQRKPDRGPAI